MRRVVVVCALALSSAIPSTAAWAAPPPIEPATGRAQLADLDGDLLDDVLGRRLRRAESGSRHAVVVATDGSLTLAGVHRNVGPFSVTRRLGIVNGFAARLTTGQIRRLVSTPGVVRIDHDAKVRITMDAARSDYGVDAARSELGLNGAGVNVCVLDTGVDAAHEQLDSKSIVWSDFIAGAPTPYDDHGHGTHVASIAVGDGVGGPQAAPLAGVAPAAGLWAGKVLDGRGSGGESAIIAGIQWCTAAAEVDVISMSLGTTLPSDGSDVLSMAVNAAVADGKIVVAAAGNSGDGPDTIAAPGAAADAITVGAASEWSAAPGAANHSDGIYLAYFSSRGGDTFAGDMKPDIVAPGVTINAANANTGNGYVVHSGTSMATPFAAGSVALAIQAAPAWSSVEVQAALEATAEDFGPPGKDMDWGAGLIDVLALTAEAKGQAGATSFPSHVHVSGHVADGGEWTHRFDVAAGDLGVPIGASIVVDGECQFFFPGFGCLDSQWSPDLDAELFDPNGVRIAFSQCMDGDECGFGRQETLHAMPTVAGTYEIHVYAYLGSPNDGLGGDLDLDLSTGPAGDSPPPPPPPPPPSIHVGDLDRSSVSLSSTRWRARATIRVHTEGHILLPGAVVRGRFGSDGAVRSCTTGTGGACTLTRDLKKSRTSLVFVVVGLSKAPYTYVAGANHDPDGDSDGTRITVTRP